MIKFNIEFGDSLSMSITEENRLELTIGNINADYNTKSSSTAWDSTVWLNKSQVKRLIRELEKMEKLVK